MNLREAYASTQRQGWKTGRMDTGRMDREQPKSFQNRRWVGAVLCLFVVLAAAYGLWRIRPGAENHNGAQQPPNRIPVQAARAEQGDIPIYLLGLGTVQAFNTVTIRSRVDGEIVKIAFQEGQNVKEGDILAQIDSRPFQAALDQANAKKAQDEAQLSSSQADLARTSELASRDYASRQQLDTDRAQVGSLTAQIQADQAAIDNAQTQLSYTTIRAPLSGRAGFRLIDQGNVVHATDQNGIVTISQIQPISVVFNAPEAELPTISKALESGSPEVWALTSDSAKELAQGKLSLVNNEVDTQSGTIPLKATFQNENGALWPGLSVDTKLHEQTLKNVVSVPDTVVQRGPNGLYAYVIKDDQTVEMRQLKVGAITDGRAVIEDGVKKDELVVTEGHYRLKPGALVQINEQAQEKTAYKR